MLEGQIWGQMCDPAAGCRATGCCPAMLPRQRAAALTPEGEGSGGRGEGAGWVMAGLWEESRFGHSTVRARTLLEPHCPCAGIWQVLLRVHIHTHACTCTHTHASASITWAPPPSLALGRYIEYITPIPVFSAPTSLPWQQEVLAPHSPLAPTA